jgi:hypothetical protein
VQLKGANFAPKVKLKEQSFGVDWIKAEAGQ